MNKIKWLIIISLIAFFGIQACDDGTIEIEDYQSEVVVDGWIEPNKNCEVLLTLSAPYFSTIDSSNLGDYALTRAKVTLIGEDDQEILTLKPNTNYFPPYIYKSTRMKGEAGKNYDIVVEYGGQKITATTTIPLPIELDSTWFALEQEKDSLGLIWVKFTDNGEVKNYYRTLTQVMGEDKKFIATYFPNFNDEFFNGKPVEASLLRGNNSNTNKKDSIYFTKGDTIMLKFCTIDKNSFDFWISFQKEIANAGNPFASTNARVKSNVNNGLGIWCGYGASYYQIIAQ
jgi:hypothetical protein